MTQEIDERLPIHREQSHKEIIKSGELVDVFTTVPIDHVVFDQSLVPDTKILSYAKKMATRLGQAGPTTLSAGFATTKDLPFVPNAQPGDVVYRVIDGLNRIGGLRLLNRDSVTGVVKFGLTEAEFQELRMSSANSTPEVERRRMVVWIPEAWETTEYYKKGISLLTALTMAANDKPTTSDKRLSQTEFEALKEWIQSMAECWNTRSISAITNIIRTASAAAPDLLSQVRGSSNGRYTGEVFSHDRFDKIVQRFPGEQYYNVQRGLKTFILDRRLMLDEIESLMEAMSGNIREGMSQEEVYTLASRRLSFAMEQAIVKRKIIRDAKEKTRSLAAIIAKQQEKRLVSAESELDDDGEELDTGPIEQATDGTVSNDIKFYEDAISNLQRSATREREGRTMAIRQIRSLQVEIERLKQEKEEIRTAMQSAEPSQMLTQEPTPEGNVPPRKRKVRAVISSLSDEEQKALEIREIVVRHLQDAAHEAGLTANQVELLYRSALRKRKEQGQR